MKHLTALILAVVFMLGAHFRVSAQAAETIWIETSKESYSASESITISLKANTATFIQGFAFQLRYDPACLEPSVPASLLSGMNYLAMPQTEGLVDAIFASTSPLSVKGGLAEVKFKALKSCQTSLKLENANLSIADPSGMAVSLPGISLGASSLVLSIAGAEAAALQATSVPEASPSNAHENDSTSTSESSHAVTPEVVPTPASSSASIGMNWVLVPLGILVGLFLIARLVIVAAPLIRKRLRLPEELPASEAETAVQLFIQRGPQAGTSLPLTQFPCRIGSGPDNEVCLSDARIAEQHAEILADKKGYTLVDLGKSQAGTTINGKVIKNQQSLLKPGDVLRIGAILLVFGNVVSGGELADASHDLAS